MPTKAQLQAQQEKTDKSARFLAKTTMGVMLTLSTAANVLTQIDNDTVSQIIAGIPPVSLFITSLLYERMRATKPIKFGMLATILVSLAFSWVHITELAYAHHQPFLIALFLPVIVDVPMLFAGTILINQSTPAPTTTPTPKKSSTPTKSTTQTKSTTTTPRHSVNPTSKTRTRTAETATA